jgi:YfiH family protein
MSDESFLEFEWRKPAGVHAAFTTRLGGVSVAPWDSFNVAAHVGDSPESVAANRKLLRDKLRLVAEPAWLNQVHGVDVVDLDDAPRSETPITGDASFTRAANRVCVIMVADCLPVLFASRDGQTIGAAHAGWRGLASGVLENTVRAMGVLPSELTSWLGPAISREHFEVGDEVREAFVKEDAAAASQFAPNSRGRWQADLPGLARLRLASLGVHEVSGGNWCTFAVSKRFYSHRRDGKGGRLAALIWKSS